ncbi:hypothetical protein Scep_019527 [Stephania cephalantha]|uniref:Uncharacterized protein n=1 Tax=Stephania cephalantha TaxID=152367 RepID=A0AAP0IBD6_9MAGN
MSYSLDQDLSITFYFFLGFVKNRGYVNGFFLFVREVFSLVLDEQYPMYIMGIYLYF